jgi:hypothetical protein
VKLFGRAFQIYDDVINLVEEKFCKMKNGLGEDITEGKISFPVIYCVSKIYGRRMSIHMLNDKSTIDGGSSEEEEEEQEEEMPQQDLLEFVNSSNVYSFSSQHIIENNERPTMDDLNTLYDILKQKTNDQEKIQEAISILKSKLKFIIFIKRIWGY